MEETEQDKFWNSKFGKSYNERNFYSVSGLNNIYKKNFGVTREEMNKEFLPNDVESFLEVGCNVGNQLNMLQYQGYENLYGIDIQWKAIADAMEHSKGINILHGSICEIPFDDEYFDCVFTSGVLIHTDPKNLDVAMAECHRVSKRFIWGFEYYAPKETPITYRSHKGFLWKNDFAKMYEKMFKDLTLVKEVHYKYLDNNNVDSMFILEKHGK